MRSLFFLFALLVGVCVACGGPTRAPAKEVTAPEVALQSETGAEPLASLVSRQPLTVLLFFTAECPVQKAHDARTRELVSTYGPKGVTFAAVVSEAGADVPAEREDAKKRALNMPVFEDRNAALADALGVEYSTHVVLLDKERRVLYSGALDADRTHLTDGSERYLQNALDAALAGKVIGKARMEALGCPLRKH